MGITSSKSFIYITTVTNCPQKDHIYLFRSTDKIEEMISECGFEVIDSLFVPTNGYSMEKAIKKKATINVAYILRRVGKGNE